MPIVRVAALLRCGGRRRRRGECSEWTSSSVCRAGRRLTEIDGSGIEAPPLQNLVFVRNLWSSPGTRSNDNTTLHTALARGVGCGSPSLWPTRDVDGVSRDARLGTGRGKRVPERAPAPPARGPRRDDVVDVQSQVHGCGGAAGAVGRGLHSLTFQLNFRTFGTHRSRQSST